MASAKAKIRHVFGDTFSCRAAPPDILVKLSDPRIAHVIFRNITYVALTKNMSDTSSVFSVKSMCQKCIGS